MKLSDAKSLWLDHLVPHMHFEEIMDNPRVVPDEADRADPVQRFGL